MENFDKEPFIITENNAENKRQYIREKRNEVLKRDPIQVYGLICEYSDAIKRKYPEWRKYQLFHILIGSSLRKESSPFLDFPSPDSVEEFLETLSDK